MAKTRREIVVNQKKYKLPARIEAETHLDYLDAVDELKDVALYRRAHYEKMAEQIAKMYGNQFTVADIFAPRYGLTLAQIMVEFSALEASVYEEVDERVAVLRENFTQKT